MKPWRGSLPIGERRVQRSRSSVKARSRMRSAHSRRGCQGIQPYRLISDSKATLVELNIIYVTPVAEISEVALH